MPYMYRSSVHECGSLTRDSRHTVCSCRWQTRVLAYVDGVLVQQTPVLRMQDIPWPFDITFPPEAKKFRLEVLLGPAAQGGKTKSGERTIFALRCALPRRLSDGGDRRVSRESECLRPGGFR